MVTPEMVEAAQRELPGVWNRERVRRALVAALALLPDGSAAEVDVQARVRVHLVVDEQQMQGAVLTAVEQAGAALPLTPAGALDLAELNLLVAGAQPVPDVRVPELNPALDRPLELGSLADIARRRGVSRSTVTGWVKNRDTNGMPVPVDGDVYDLAAVDAWYREWKGLDDAA